MYFPDTKLKDNVPFADATRVPDARRCETVEEGGKSRVRVNEAPAPRSPSLRNVLVERGAAPEKTRFEVVMGAAIAREIGAREVENKSAASALEEEKRGIKIGTDRKTSP